MIRRINALSV